MDQQATTAGFSRDPQGLCTWELQLGPGEEKRVNLKFTVKMPHNVRWIG